ncbi:hypothetical protein GHT06_010137 [Daphnia sinensis]|uniref:Beta-1,4-N-acetylgalactosaminyltransferase n=1 Tax=Daphnia sinensis TaxID=1820382 RepID=A0AAD5LRK8_9CRUS|nr:hypothetical protein GHT06_010137 [Daphnia sinensis]
MDWSHVTYLRVLIRPVLIASITIFICVFWIQSNSSDIDIKSAQHGHQLAVQSVQLCPLISPRLIGWTNLSLEAMSAISKEDEGIVELRMKQSGVKPGGRYEPSRCQSRHKVAIIVPVRNRTEHLAVFLRYMHPFLQRQQLSYAIFVVEQSERSPFNRGMLMNIGFKEAQLSQEEYQCVILHDVDMLPEHDGNPYTCPEDGKPRQMAFSVDHWNNYNSVSWNFLGAVTAMSANDFQRINGYSNAFWGWGGEDDQLFQRTKSQNLTVVRAFDGTVSQVVHYKTMSHPRATPNPDRMSVINEGWKKFQTDGLVDLRYTRLSLKLEPLCTRIVVDIQPYNITT